MRRGVALVVIGIGVAAPTLRAEAQVGGTNLVLGQVGNYPGVAPANRQDLYDQTNVDFAAGSNRFGLRFEADRNSEDQFTYQQVTQRWADLNDTPFHLRLGNFYTILGRGLLHRSFEIPGVVLDQIGIRSRYAFSREMDGALAEAELGPIGVRAFSGTANAGLNSPAADALGLKRYLGQFSGAQLTGTIRPGTQAGVAYERTNSAGADQEELGSGFLDADPLAAFGVGTISLPLYFEYAQANGSLGDWWKLRRAATVPHALYASVGFLWDRLGFTGEWKDYAQFRRGTNDPPSLVREQTYLLLNRATHVLDAGRETGYQFELSAGLTQWGTVVANVSRGDGAALNRYREQYVELKLREPKAARWDAAAFWDASEDRVSALDDSRTYGGAFTARVFERWSGHVDLERQTAVHPNGALPSERFENFVLSLTAARAGWGSLAMVWDRTSDSIERSVFPGGGKFVHLISWVLGAHLSPQNDITLTVGKQRGGRACTAGTCYEVQPFDGAELRWVTRF